MKERISIYGYCVLILLLFQSLYSCKHDNEDIINNAKDRVPENVELANYTSTSITVSWSQVEGATSYTLQLLGAKDADKPVKTFIVIADDSYTFDGLTETDSYYARIRTNLNTVTSDWVYILNNQEPARIIPRYGIVDEDFEPIIEKELYANFPEGWEVHNAGVRKPSFTGDGPTGAQSDIFPSGEWLMPNIYTLSVASMAQNRIGDWAVMFRGGGSYTPYLEMNFDLPEGASKLSFYYGAATQNATDSDGVPIYLTAEYSQDSGDTWTQIGDRLEISDAAIQYFQEYELDIKGPVRFRIGKNNATAARMMVDEISVYKN